MSSQCGCRRQDNYRGIQGNCRVLRLLQSKCNFGIIGCAFMLAIEFTKPFGFADVNGNFVIFEFTRSHHSCKSKDKKRTKR